MPPFAAAKIRIKKSVFFPRSLSNTNTLSLRLEEAATIEHASVFDGVGNTLLAGVFDHHAYALHDDQSSQTSPLLNASHSSVQSEQQTGKGSPVPTNTPSTQATSSGSSPIATEERSPALVLDGHAIHHPCHVYGVSFDDAFKLTCV